MTKKPSIILHPGLPKCATSTIQRMFVLEEHALGKSLGVKFIGRNFEADNGYPDVSKIMYNPQLFLRDIAESKQSPDHLYFLSNEALDMSPDVLSAIADRFEITRTIVTVRFPPLQVISTFCYSSWLRYDFGTNISKRSLDPFLAINRFRTKIERFKSYCDDVLVCPTESDRLPLEKRFLQICFNRIPDILNQPPFSNAVVLNKSICLAFAEALAQEVALSGLIIPGPKRIDLVKRAQSYALPDILSALTIPAIGSMTFRDFESSLSGYLELLRDFRLPAEEVEAAESVVHRNVDALLAAQVATQTQMDELREHARTLLADAL